MPGAAELKAQYRERLRVLGAEQPQGEQLWQQLQGEQLWQQLQGEQLWQQLQGELLWQQLLEEEEELASCLEEAGWPRAEAPGHIAQLYQHLSKHAHNKLQLSLRRVDIMVSAPAFQAGWQPGRLAASQPGSQAGRAAVAHVK